MKTRQLVTIVALALCVLLGMAWTLFNLSAGDLDTLILSGMLTTLAVILFVARIKSLI